VEEEEPHETHEKIRTFCPTLSGINPGGFYPRMRACKLNRMRCCTAPFLVNKDAIEHLSFLRYNQRMSTLKFWDRVKSAIKKKGLTQQTVAEACGLSPGTFKGWMAKGILPTVVDAYFIARFLGVTVEYLVTGTERKANKQIKKVRSLLSRADRELERCQG
jgi:DNA-binding XRE family transcriptional regulator